MYFALLRAGRLSETVRTQQAWSLQKNRASTRAGRRGWPSMFCSFEIISGRKGSSESGKAEFFSCRCSRFLRASAVPVAESLKQSLSAARGGILRLRQTPARRLHEVFLPLSLQFLISSPATGGPAK